MTRFLLRLRLVRNEAGYNLVEMLTVMIIMGVVMAGLTDIFTSASKADTDMKSDSMKSDSSTKSGNKADTSAKPSDTKQK